MGEILLVEPFETEETNSLISDPSKYVSVTAQTKDSIKAKIEETYGTGVAPVYKFYNPTSRVTLVDSLEGKNLVNDEYYNYVAMAEDKLFLAKNEENAKIMVFPIQDKKIIDEEKEEVITDLGEEITIPEEANFSFDEITEETPTETVSAGEGVEVETPMDEDRAAEIEKRLSELNDKYSNPDAVLSQLDTREEERERIDDPLSVFANSEFKVDSIDNMDDDGIGSYEEEPNRDIDDSYGLGINATTIDDAAKIIPDLVQMYKEKDNELRGALEREERLKTQIGIYKEKYEAQTQKFNLVNAKNRSLTEEKIQYEAKIESLTTTADLQKRQIEEQRRTIGEKDREIERLNSQVAGQAKLARAVETAKALMGYEDSYSEEEPYYKVAA